MGTHLSEAIMVGYAKYMMTGNPYTVFDAILELLGYRHVEGL